MKVVTIIQLINQKDFNKLVSDGVIGKCHMNGNNNSVGKHSCGFYDVRKYRKAKRENPNTPDKYLKLIASHVGVVITKNKIYIEDYYVK